MQIQGTTNQTSFYTQAFTQSQKDSSSLDFDKIVDKILKDSSSIEDETLSLYEKGTYEDFRNSLSKAYSEGKISEQVYLKIATASTTTLLTQAYNKYGFENFSKGISEAFKEFQSANPSELEKIIEKSIEILKDPYNLVDPSRTSLEDKAIRDESVDILTKVLEEI